MSPSNPPSKAPTAAELLADPVVIAALEQAWIDSQADDPAARHEEGGWIYMNLLGGTIMILSAPQGNTHGIDLSSPPLIPDSCVVGKFHTHPNPVSAGWLTGPSPNDLIVDARHGVPDLIRAEDGVHLSGPASRRGGLGGNGGYPS